MSELTAVPVEQRFPLDLAMAIPAIDRLYEAAKLDVWAPADDIDWTGAQFGSLSEEQREAGCLVWSRRAWLEYTGIDATPALLLRFCLERGREVDAKYFLTVKNTEEAELVDAYYRYAELLGGYLERPADPAWEAVINRGLSATALDPAVSFDGYVAAHCALEGGLELELCRAHLVRAREPVARALLARAVCDKTRHAAFGWSYLESRAQGLTAAERVEVEGALTAWLQDVAYAGYHVASLATAIDSSPEQAAQALCATAGLGAATASEEEEAFRDYLAAARTRLQALGIALSAAPHPRLGPL